MTDMKVFKTLKPRNLELIRAAALKVAQAKQFAEKAQALYIEANDDLNARMELAIGRDPINVNIDLATGIVTIKAENNRVKKEMKSSNAER